MKNLLEETIFLAHETHKQGNYPIGSLITDLEGNIIHKEHNKSFSENDPSAHAEILCIRNSKVLQDKTKSHILYSSLEPCFGCSFFLRYTNISKVVFALSDPFKGGLTELKVMEKTKSDFEEIEIIAEPFGDVRDESKKLMYEFLTSKGKVNAAKHFLI